MKMGKNEVIVLCADGLGKNRDRLAAALEDIGLTVAGVLEHVDQGMVNGYDEQGYAAHVIGVRRAAAPETPVRDD
jgi:hypothetical protein